MKTINTARLALIIGILGALTGCAHAVAPTKAAPVNIYSDFDEKVPGAWIIIIDPSVEFSREVKPSTYVCSAHSYPLSSGDTIRDSLKTMFDRIVEEPIYRSQAPDAAELASTGARGVAVVRLDGFTPRLACQQGFWSGTCAATVEMTFGFEAKNAEGRLMGTSVGSEKTYDGDSGAMCGDASNILAEAYRLSLKDSLERLAERISNARRMREQEIKSEAGTAG
jgi:hypothetical protein